MKFGGQTITGDGFDKIVAEKMPKIKQQEEPFPSDHEVEPRGLNEVRQEIRPLDKGTEEKINLPSSKERIEEEQNLDVIRLIEDLHTQLLASSRTKKALDMDLSSSQKTIYQLAQDNKELRSQQEALRKEIQGLKEIRSESTYLMEENTDALERIRELQQELRTVKETLINTTQERNDALGRIRELESQLEQNDLFKIKGRLKEREASHLSDENRELQSRLEEALAQNMELQGKHEALRKSFNEVKDSLILLRDACKLNYYNLSENSE
jgi:DNA repair exonuclease SbcCD ATPase subunit